MLAMLFGQVISIKSFEPVIAPADFTFTQGKYKEIPLTAELRACS
jgi:hypothetical protein